MFIILYTDASNEYLSLFISNSSQIIAILIVLRMWLLFFDYKKRKDLLAYKWQSQLKDELKFVKNEKTRNRDSINRILKQKHTLSNSTKMNMYGIMFYVILVASILCAYFFDENIFNFLQIAIVGFYSVALFLGYYNVHRCHDELDIRGIFNI